MFSKFRAFCRKKDVVLSLRRYGIDALGAMAQGLFCSLLIGTIIKTAGQQLNLQLLIDIGTFAGDMSGAAMAIAIGYALKAPPLVLFSLAAVGYTSNAVGGAGGPLAVLFIAILSAEAGKLVSKETKIDLLVTPLVTIFLGIAVSVLVGIALTLPISSAAICHTLGLAGLAGGAAVAGCCAQMVGFAVMSFRENKWGGLVSQGIGTSMLQMGNIVKNPRIWLPAILTSAITGPLATCVFGFQMNGDPVAAGMGTCGFVGQIGVYTGWVREMEAGVRTAITGWDWLGMLLICFILPGVICWLLGLLLRKIGWIKEGDLTLH